MKEELKELIDQQNTLENQRKQLMLQKHYIERQIREIKEEINNIKL
jgi:chaperonin cofactor prefoldin